ncbi:sulfite exporter TauE/SafE family protein [Candidatus Mycobacterium methanotrophicum]|uniref:Probable membrane transporter protein n=1 Tax=Candidatus Mycobacterium methanotrophicum TaxID=2943498 RepID=A0ABY4QLV8_9MYCO|nr:sulfite exporter TauE/SafE family protein [Candidatus Mycobacterium methanotrophicum]UQX10935.1 sulfite exporter TauE/SafE family protein [Candidatus Mycobacterium methanotrophicum]
MSTARLAALGTTGVVSVSAPLGLLIGLSLGALGGGGSVLAVPALVYGVGQSAHAATTTSLLAVGATALVGMLGHLHAGRVRLASGLIFGLVGAGGSLLGSLLSKAIPNNVLLVAFSALILVAAWRMHGRHTETPCHTSQLAKANAAHKHGQPATVSSRGESTSAPTRQAGGRKRVTVATVTRVAIAGSIVGFLTGFFGVGGGFVIVPGLVLALGFDMPVAVGTSLLVIAISSAESLAFRLPREQIDWLVAAPLTAAGIVGVLFGDVVAARVPAERLTRWFVWLLVVVACGTAVQAALSR